jgi:hypothetical protein
VKQLTITFTWLASDDIPEEVRMFAEARDDGSRLYMGLSSQRHSKMLSPEANLLVTASTSGLGLVAGESRISFHAIVDAPSGVKR